MRFVSDAQRRKIFALYKKGGVIYSDVYPEVAVKSRYSPEFVKRELTELRDPRQPEYGEHLLKNISRIKRVSKLPDKWWVGMYSPADESVSIIDPESEHRMGGMPQNILAHEIGHAIQERKKRRLISEMPKVDFTGGFDEQLKEVSVQTKMLIDALDTSEKSEEYARDLEFRRKPLFEEHLSEYATPTEGELVELAGEEMI